jgi:hypothetical protein
MLSTPLLLNPATNWTAPTLRVSAASYIVAPEIETVV